MSHSKTQYPSMTATQVGPSATALAVALIFLQPAEIQMMPLYCCFVKPVNGTTRVLILWTWYDSENSIYPMPKLTITPPTGPYSVLSRGISAGSVATTAAAFKATSFSAIVTRWLRRREGRALYARTPLRHAQGVIGLSSAHKPIPRALAARSNSARVNALGANRLYHHANPALIISSVTSRPSANRILATCRAYLSCSMRYATGAVPASNDPRNTRDVRNANCPFSGASSPHNRKVNFRPTASTNMMVSPSHILSINHTEFSPC